MEFTWNTPEVLQLNENCNRPPQIHARGAGWPWLGRGAHESSRFSTTKDREHGSKYRPATHVQSLPSAADRFVASFSSRTHRPCHTPGRSGNNGRRRQSGAMKTGAYIHVREDSLRSSMGHLVSVLPVIEPAGEEGFGTVGQHFLECSQKDIWRL